MFALELPDYADNDSFAWHDIIGDERWFSFTPVPVSLTVVGAASYSGRWRGVGRSTQFQMQLSAATSIASTAGTTYVPLPVTPAKGLAGMAVMTDATTGIAVGLCHIDITNSRVYLPALSASGDTFNVFGEYEV